MARKEIFSLPPRAVSIPHGKPRLSMMDRQIAALRSEQERNAMQIRTRDELIDDLTNFSFTTGVDEFGLPLSTPYQIPEDVPDMLPVSPENTTETTKNQNSVSNEDSPNPQSGTE